MHTRLTIETDPDQEMIIGLLLTGSMGRATRKMVEEYFTPIIEKEKKHLDELVKNLLASVGVEVKVEVEGLGD